MVLLITPMGQSLSLAHPRPSHISLSFLSLPFSPTTCHSFYYQLPQPLPLLLLLISRAPWRVVASFRIITRVVMASLRLIIRTHDHSPIFPKYSHVYPTTYNSTQRLQSVFLTPPLARVSRLMEAPVARLHHTHALAHEGW